MRILKLINSLGEELDLMDLAHFGHEPKGLGVAFSNTYEQNGLDFISTERKLNQGQLSLQLILGAEDGDSYERFFEFVRFLDSQPLTLSYTAKGIDTFLRDGLVAGLDKSEIGSYRALTEPFTLDFITPWYRWEEGRKAENNSVVDGTGKIYQNTNTYLNQGHYVYDYAYQENYGGESLFFVLENHSLYLHQKTTSPLEVTVWAKRGEVVNPSWVVQRGESILQSDGYRLTIPKGGRLVVSSNPQGQEALLYTENGDKVNVYQHQDITKSNFVTAPLGKSILLFENVENADVTYRLRKEWAVV